MANTVTPNTSVQEIAQRKKDKTTAQAELDAKNSDVKETGNLTDQTQKTEKETLEDELTVRNAEIKNTGNLTDPTAKTTETDTDKTASATSGSGSAGGTKSGSGSSKSGSQNTATATADTESASDGSDDDSDKTDSGLFTDRNGVSYAYDPSDDKTVLEVSNGLQTMYVTPSQLNSMESADWEILKTNTGYVDSDGVSHGTGAGTSTKTGSSSYPESEVESFRNGLSSYQSSQEDLIDERYAALLEAANAATDYATKTTIANLQDTLTEYQQKYDEERQKLAYSTAQAEDNLALKNAANGINGGIANKLYSDQQATADSQLYAINLEELNFEADIDQQIDEAISKGEYEKAQTIAEYGIAKLEEYANLRSEILGYEYNSANAIDTFNQNKANFDESVREYDLSYAQTEANNAYNRAIALIEAGASISAEDAEALGIDAEWAQEFADRVNTLAQLDIDQAKAELEYTQKQTALAGRSSSSGSGSGETAETQSYTLSDYISASDTESELYYYLINVGNMTEAEATAVITSLENEGVIDVASGKIKHETETAPTEKEPSAAELFTKYTVGAESTPTTDDLLTKAGVLGGTSDYTDTRSAVDGLSPAGKTEYSYLLEFSNPEDQFNTLTAAHATGKSITDNDYIILMHLLNLFKYLK